MRRLFLLRHAKTVPLSMGDDFDRELTERGEADSRKIGAYMAREGLAPDYAIYSGSARTKATYDLAAAALPAFEASEVNAIYEATWQLILGLLRELPAEARDVLVVGHNPGMADIANALSGEGSDVARLKMAGKFPPGALAVVAFDRPEWASLSPRSGRLERFVVPSEL